MRVREAIQAGTFGRISFFFKKDDVNARQPLAISSTQPITRYIMGASHCCRDS